MSASQSNSYSGPAADQPETTAGEDRPPLRGLNTLELTLEDSAIMRGLPTNVVMAYIRDDRKDTYLMRLRCLLGHLLKIEEFA